MKSTNEIMSAIISNIGGTVVRKNSENFIAIELEDGTYAKIAVSGLLSRDTKVNRAFNLEECVNQYAEWQKVQEIKANQPKKEKAVNTEAQAKRDAMDAALTEWFNTSAEEGKQYTATELVNALFPNESPMVVGSSAIRLANNGVITMEKDAKGKRHYSK